MAPPTPRRTRPPLLLAPSSPPSPASRPLPAPTLRQWRSEQRSFSSGKPSRSVSRPQRTPLPAQPMAHCEQGGERRLRRPRTPPPHSTPLPVLVRAHARAHHAGFGAIALHHAVGLLVARAGGAVGAQALVARAAAGGLVAHEAGLALAALEGALRVGGGRSAGDAASSPHLPCRPSVLLLSSGLTRVLTHTELGTQLCCPVSHSLMSVQTWGGGSAEVTAPAQTPEPGAGRPLRATSPLHPAADTGHSSLGPLPN